jgi:hypothetical protein
MKIHTYIYALKLPLLVEFQQNVGELVNYFIKYFKSEYKKKMWLL